MAEYNIQMNRYVSASDSYDQLFPKTKTIDVVDQNGDNLDTLLGEKIDYDEKGAANGVASLGADGKVPSSQLPATGYSKDETLTAATAALYGLTNAVPDDVFAWLGRYAEHCWKRRTHIVNIDESDITDNLTVVTSGSSRNIQYSTYLNDDGSLSNPQTISISPSLPNAQNLANLAPCFISGIYSDSAGVYHLPNGATAGARSSGATIAYWTSNDNTYLNKDVVSPSVIAKIVNSVTVNVGDWELVFSTNRNAYPDSGIQDGYEYEYLGVPFEKLPTAPRIETGSYVGTGTYGASNPTVFSCGSLPKMIFVVGDNKPVYYGGILLCFGFTDNYAVTNGYAICGSIIQNNSYSYAKIVGNTVSVYTSNSDARYQFNSSGINYKWIAIG